MRNLLRVVMLVAMSVAGGYVGGRLAGSGPTIVGETAPAPAVPPPAERTIPDAPPRPPPPPPSPMQQSAAVALSSSYRSAVERAAPSVVTVYSARVGRRGPLGLGGQELLSQGLGSGVIVDDQGHVVTNNHVVQGATELAIVLPDGTLRDTRVIGVDPDSDLALLAIDPKGLRPVAIGSTRDLAVGDVVLAVGNPLGVGQTVTQGIVSAIGRKGIGINPIENFIQTDAAINPGNSGGALIDVGGRLVGINSAIVSRGGGFEGIGFAIPVEFVQQVVASLAKTGKVSRGWLGVSTEATGSGKPGALIVAVQRAGPAHRAGLAAGDVVLRFNGAPVEQPDDLVASILQLEPGTRVRVEFERNGRHEAAEVELGRRPPLRRSAPG